MRIAMIAVAAGLGLCACQPAAQKGAMASASAVSAAAAPLTADKMASVIESRKLESDQMAKAPGWASRSGDTLTVSKAGKALARFTDTGLADCDGFDQCALWTFGGVIQVAGQAYPLVLQENGEITRYMLVDNDGSLVWFNNVPMVSASGRWLATANDDEYTDPILAITDWQSPGHATVVSFADPPCQPQHWNADDTLDVVCQPDGDPAYPARVAFDGKTWKMAANGEAAVPGGVDPSQTPQQAAETAAYLTKYGYARARP